VDRQEALIGKEFIKLTALPTTTLASLPNMIFTVDNEVHEHRVLTAGLP
jgi:hypothetical protein